MKLMSPKAFYYTVGKKNFFQYILFGIFVLFFYLPLMNLCMLAFADKYEVPAIIPPVCEQTVFHIDALG